MAKKAELEVLPLAEASQLHFGKWVLLKVTNRDENGAISHGQVVKASKSRAAISRAVARMHHQDPTCQLYVFVGGERKVTGDELRAALRRVAEEEDFSTSQNWSLSLATAKLPRDYLAHSGRADANERGSGERNALP